MVRSENYRGKPIHLCDVCGFGYTKKDLAQACEAHCRKYGACSLEITKHAIKKR